MFHILSYDLVQLISLEFSYLDTQSPVPHLLRGNFNESTDWKKV